MNIFSYSIKTFIYVSLIGICFVACSKSPQKSTSRFSGVEGVQALPPEVTTNSMENYFSGLRVVDDDPQKNLPMFKSNASIGSVADCVHYNALYGRNATATDPNRVESCRYLEKWEDLENENNWTIPDVKTALTQCRGDGSSGRYLVMDLKLDPTDFSSVSHQFISSGSVVVGVAYCLDFSANADHPEVYVLNPDHLQYEVLSQAQNYSFLEQLVNQSGWVRGTFVKFDSNNNIARASSTFRLKRYQFEGKDNIDLLENVSGNEIYLPQMEISVRPRSFSAWDPHFQMGVYHTDAQQTLRRSADIHAGVNPLTGELAYATVDALSPQLTTTYDFSINRTYRSFNARVGSFGYGWDFAHEPHLKYYSFNNPISANETVATYPFLETGEGRTLYQAGLANDAGMFWGKNPFNEQTDHPYQPDVLASALFHGSFINENFDLNGRQTSVYDHSTGNSVYKLYEGELILLMDQIGVRLDTETRQLILEKFKLAAAALGTGTSPSDITTAFTHLQTIQSYPGNFVYFHRDPGKGYIKAAITKTGIVWYTYRTESEFENADGDLLSYVTRYVQQNSNEGASLGIQNFRLDQYQYDDRRVAGVGEGINESWGGLLTFVKYNFYQPIIDGVEYEHDPSLFSEAPVVTSITDRVIDNEFEYHFKNTSETQVTCSIASEIVDCGFGSTCEDGLCHRIEPYTVVTDEMNRTYTYYGAEIPYAKKVMGPTETSASEVLREEFWDRKLLRPIDTIARGQERIYKYNSETGFLESVSVCAQRNLPSRDVDGKITAEGSSFTASLANQTAQGVVENLECDVPSDDFIQKIEMSDQNVFYVPYFLNWNESLIYTESVLPTSALINQAERKVTTNINPATNQVELECFFDTGVTKLHGLSKSGTDCSPVPDARGGNWLHLSQREEYQNGQLRNLMDEKTPNPDILPGEQNRIELGSEPFDSLTYQKPLAFGGLDQTGFVVDMPSLGFDKQYEPTDFNGTVQEVQMTGRTYRFFDPYGNPIVELNSKGAQRYYIYDYRGVTPQLVAVREEGMLLIDSNIGPTYTEVSRSAVPVITTNGLVYQEATDVTTRISAIQGSTGGNIRYPIQRDLDSVTLRVSSEISPAGDLVSYTYYDEISKQYLVKSIKSKSVAKCTIDISGLCLPSTLESDWKGPTVYYGYDSFDRPDTKTEYLSEDLSNPHIEWETFYRTSYDRAPYKWAETQYNTGGASTETEIMTWNSFGQPTSIEVRRSGTEQADSVFSYIYGPFGERLQEHENYDNQDIYHEVEMDHQLGVVTKEVNYASGDRVNTETEVTESSNFDVFLNAFQTEDAVRGIKNILSSSSIPGFLESKSIEGPTTYKGSGNAVFSTTRTAYDGCGNPVLIETEQGATLGSFVESSAATIESFFCSRQETTDPSGRKMKFYYTSGGEGFVQDNTDNNPTGDDPNGVADRPISFHFNVDVCNRDPNTDRCEGPRVNVALDHHSTPAGTDAANALFDYELVASNVIISSRLGVLSESEFNPIIGTYISKNHEYKNATTLEEASWDSLFSGTRSIEEKDLPFQFSREDFDSGALHTATQSLVGDGAVQESQTRVHPIQGTQEISTQRTYDPLGHELTMVMSQTQPTQTPLITTSTDQNLGFEFGVPKKKTVVHPVAEGNYTVTLETDMGDGRNPESIKTTSIHKDYVQTVETNYGYDGLGRIASADSFSASFSMSGETPPTLDSVVETERDLSGKINHQTITLTDAVLPGQQASYTINGQTFSRTVLGLTNPSQEVTYTKSYNVNGNELYEVYLPTGVDKGFTITYEYMGGPMSESVRRVVVQTPETSGHPNGIVHHWDGIGTSIDDAFPAGVDPKAGQVINNSSDVEWPPTYPISGLHWSMIGKKYQLLVDGGQDPDEYFTDYEYRTQDFGVGANSYFETIKFEDGGDAYSSPDPANILSTTDNVSYSFGDLSGASGADKYRSCDNTLWKDDTRFSHTRGLSAENANWKYRKNSIGQPALILHQFADSSKPGGGYRWNIRASHEVGASGDLDLTEELISFKGGVFFTSMTPVRVVQSRRFTFDTPFGAKLNFREFIHDSGNHPTYNSIARTEFQRDWSGNWFYIPSSIKGNSVGPVFAYRQEKVNGDICLTEETGCEWAVYIINYDAAGNARHFQRCDNDDSICYGSGGFDGLSSATAGDCRKPPRNLQVYGGYMGSIIGVYPSSIEWESPSFCATSNIVYETGDPDYAVDFAPDIQPYGPSRFGSKGGRKDIHGNIYLDGKVFDSFNGRELDGVDGTNSQSRCLVQPEGMQAAKIYADTLRLRDLDELENRAARYSPSVKSLAKLDKEYEQFLSGETFHPCQLIDRSNLFGLYFRSQGSASVASLRCFARFSGYDAKWYYRTRGMEPGWVHQGESIAYGVAGVAGVATLAGFAATAGVVPVIQSMFAPAAIMSDLPLDVAMGAWQYATGPIEDPGF